MLDAKAQDEGFHLALPLVCSVGKDCFVQQYVDRDTSAGVKDYRCGSETYDGHDGVDIRVLSTDIADRGVTVVAPAPGAIKAVRDGVPDKLLASTSTPSDIAGRECGNGVVIEHADGFETQLCHLRNGSLRIHKGDLVKTGAEIGMVGYSGKAAFAHLHITVRWNGRTIDPFTGELSTMAPSCGKEAQNTSPLWTPDALRALAYQDGQLIEIGFASAMPTPGGLEEHGGHAADPRPTDDAIVVYGRFINLHQGDRVRVSLQGPQSLSADYETQPLDRPKATYVASVGKKLRAERWPAGQYQGKIALIRDGRVAQSADAKFELGD